MSSPDRTAGTGTDRLGDDPAASSPVPHPLRVASEFCGRVLVIVAAVAVVAWALAQIRLVVIPVAIALLLAALLIPAVSWLARHRVPRSVATLIVMIGGLAVLVGVLSFVVQAFIAGIPDLGLQLERSYQQFRDVLARPPFNINSPELATIPDQIRQTLAANQDALTSGALTTAGTVVEALAGLALALFALIFFLYDGRRIWRFLLRAVPAGPSRERIDVAGDRAFASLVGYTRATVLVAVVDGLAIGLGLWIVGVPLVIPLAALTFLAAFIPTVGAVLSGAVAVLVALVTLGPIQALIILGVVIGVQQLEGNVLQPLLLGRAVQLHPLAVALAVAAGVVVAGIIGALLAVPLLAVANSVMRSLSASFEQSPDEVDPEDPRQARPPRWFARGGRAGGKPGGRSVVRRGQPQPEPETSQPDPG